MVFRHADGTWRRTGECNGCGECCQFVDPAPHAAGSHFTAAEHIAATEPSCPLLRREGDRFRCAGHGAHPYYLAGCAAYPTHPRDLVNTPSCSYRFERV